MSGIGSRLRQERERLGLSQKKFGEVGGVEANAQGRYESGDRVPKADYLSRVAAKGVDVLYIVTGRRTPTRADNLSQSEEKILVSYRALYKEDQDAIRHLTHTLAELSVSSLMKERRTPESLRAGRSQCINQPPDTPVEQVLVIWRLSLGQHAAFLLRCPATYKTKSRGVCLIRVLVVDDHDLVRTGITRMLADIDGLQVVGQAESGEESLLKARELKPDVVLMDVKMPGIGGLEATRKLLRSHPDIKVVAVTVCEEDPFPTRLLQAGAAGYLTKGAGLNEMVQAIRLVFAGQRYISPQIAQQLVFKSFQPSSESPFDALSEREIQIALMIVGCQKVQIISDKLCLSPKTVNTYRYRIFEKLSISSDVELTLLAVRHGMVDASA